MIDPALAEDHSGCAAGPTPRCGTRSDRITAESFATGTTVSAVARRNGVSLGLLQYWRRKARDKGVVEELRFVPVAVAAEPRPSGAGSIELEVADVRIRMIGTIDVTQLRAVLAAVRT
jgi:hypothetical protein